MHIVPAGSIAGMTAAFRGWSEVALDFYRQLEADNTKAFWTAHRDVYEREVREPFEAFAEFVAGEFGEMQIFRPYRDVRFSKDKSPYKTRCYGAIRAGEGSSLYVELSARGLVVAAGHWMMDRDQLDRYRRAVDDAAAGEDLARIVADLARRKLVIEGPRLKTAPRGWPRDHPRIELLRLTSVAVLRRFEPAAWLATKAAARRITDVWRAAAPLTDWLGRHVGPAAVTDPGT
jgi:uncharacterized protein (TIGR02453 family)